MEDKKILGLEYHKSTIFLENSLKLQQMCSPAPAVLHNGFASHVVHLIKELSFRRFGA